MEVAEEAETQQTRMLKAECAWLKEEVAAGQQKQEDLRAAAHALKEELAAQQQQQLLQQQQQQPHQVALCRLHSTFPLYPSKQPLTRRRVICRHTLHSGIGSGSVCTVCLHFAQAFSAAYAGVPVHMTKNRHSRIGA